jgi:hypothetical protein
MKTSYFPKQKISRAQKNQEWGKSNIDAMLKEATFPDTSSASEFGKYYRAYNGEMNENDYSYITNPYKGETWRAKKMPARLRSYNIIKPVVDILMGEKARRPFNYHVVVMNPDVVSRMDEMERQILMENIKQQFINEMNALGVPTGVPSQEIPSPEESMKEFKVSYKDARAIMGEEAVEYMIMSLDLPDKLMTAFFDWLITGYVYTYKDVLWDDLDYQVVNPLDIVYEKSPDTTFIEDSRWVVRRNFMTANEILDRFHDKLKPSDIDWLEDPAGRDQLDLPFLPYAAMRYEGELIPVYHGVWKSYARIGFLKYPNPYTGEMEEMEVADFYKPEPGETVRWEWINEIWEIYRIGSESGIYLGLQPIRAQRNAMNNPSICKLPYNGRAYSDRNADNISVVSMGLPYQELYNIFHYRLELSIAKNKDKIALMEINMIPKRHGWDEDKFMYFMDAMGVAYIDSTAEGQGGDRPAFNNFQVLDMSLGKYIESQFNLLEMIKFEWEESQGISRQRKGQTMASDAVGNNERAIYQGSVMSEEMFRRFATVEQKDFQGLLDLSQVAWVKGKKASYINSQFKQAYLDIIPEEYCNADLGVFVLNSSKEDEKLNTLRQLSLEFAQNGAKPSTIAEILEAGNFAKIKAKLVEVEQAQAEYEQVMAAQEADAQERIVKLQIEDREDQQAFEAAEKEKDRQKDIYIAELNARVNLAKNGMTEPEAEGEDVAVAVEERSKEADRQLKRDEINRKYNIEERKLRLEREKIRSQEKIARMTKNKPASKK